MADDLMHRIDEVIRANEERFCPVDWRPGDPKEETVRLELEARLIAALAPTPYPRIPWADLPPGVQQSRLASRLLHCGCRPVGLVEWCPWCEFVTCTAHSADTHDCPGDVAPPADVALQRWLNR